MKKHGKAICYKCECVVETTLKERDYVINDIIIPNLLVAVCNTCDEITTIPAQSTDTIKKFLWKTQ